MKSGPANSPAPESSDDAGKIEGKAVEFDFAVGKEIAFDLPRG